MGAPSSRREVSPPEDRDDARRVSQRGKLGEKALLDLLRPLEPLELDRPLGVDERLDRPDAGGEAGGDEILALADEQAELRALPSRRELAHELQARVRGRSDHETQSIVLAWPSRRASRRRPSGHVSTSSAKP